ncbi:DNA-directed DNA polymerase II small subunit [archaeon]|jgi:DNA polymerase II small subunit|nr:DNA-directed DNA polymerase II small subunit [archaeon]MBT3450979.1 DNA-directed DNA polymerase II small subunit [archaeon]MBT6868601.1 DNA-directed DNA polymerase II small subunit [archaeon]MBT7193133.1 DNA-directed DNA polymerase II small subunit [archaeon]MBT7381113.1 DNA-directed DNA polymerase II small subunit [archaeon]
MSLDQEKLIEKLFEKGILVNKELLELGLKDELIEKVVNEGDLLVLNKDYSDILNSPEQLVDWYEVDQHRVDFEKKGDNELYQTQLQEFKIVKVNITNVSNNSKDFSKESNIESFETELKNNNSSVKFESNIDITKDNEINDIESSIINNNNKINNLNYEILCSYVNNPFKYTVKDFAKQFRSRYQFLEKVIRQRSEIKNLLSINRLFAKKERDNVSIIGIITEINETRNGNLIIEVEDPTGQIKILINKSKKDLFKKGKDLVPDEIVGIIGVNGDNIIFVEDLVWPDIPITNEMKKIDKDEYAVFLSDVHVGSTYFLEEEFNKFLRWLSGKTGNQSQKEVASKVKYIFIAGDLVDGIGIYPAQESELTITDINKQYTEFTRLLSQVPKDKTFFICPGNHDAVHLAEPQPNFFKEYSESLFDIDNLILLSNPSVVNIGKSDESNGLNILMYHGYSFDYYVSNVDSIRNGGGYERADLIMKFLLQRRHLAPSFKSTPYLPSHSEDPLLIKNIPDIIITGHIHYSSVANYRGVTMISGSCWQGQTKFQEKLGHNPQPGRVPIVNLKTREVKVLKFV